MKKKPVLMALGMMLLSSFGFAQNGLEGIIVEKYYVSNAADAASADADLSANLYPTGTLPSGSVTWRIYADLAPGWGVQVVYGENGRPVVLSTSTSFFNHPNGTVKGVPVPSLLGAGTGMLDSYVTVGAVSGSDIFGANRFGVIKGEDGPAGGANITFDPGILANADPSAGLPLSTADGVYNSGGTPSQLPIQLLGDAAGAPANLFGDGAITGGAFNSSNAVWGVLGEQQGPLASNRVLIGQFTTNGIFTYALNIQIRNATTSTIQRYVYANPSSGDIVLPSLAGVVNAPTAYVIPSAAGVKTTPLLTVGQAALNGYRMVGIPDGMGGFDNGDGTYTLLMNHELGSTVGVNRAHGAKGAFVSKWIINKSNNIALNGSDLIQDVFIWNGTSYIDSAYAIARLCSGDLPASSAFYNPLNGNGTQNRIFMSGEETGPEGKAFAHIVTGPDGGKSYELPYLGKFSWENAVARPYISDKTLVIGTDDATPGQVYVYIGTKLNSGNDIQRAGLANGKLYGIAVNGLTAEVNASFPAPNTAFTMVDLGFVNSLTGAALNTASNSAGVTNFLRPEDAVFDPRNPNVFYFVTTNNFTSNSRLWKVEFNDINNPELGGKITVLLEGGEGHKMLDNMTMDAYGNILMQEDPGNQSHIAKVWQYNTETDILKLIAEHDSAFFVSGGSKYLGTQDEESSGIFDASAILGPGMNILNVQAHYAIPGELVEGGQLLTLYNPDTYLAESKGPSSSQTPYVAPSSPGVKTKAILTVGDTASNGYKLVGIPDGMGAYDNGDGTFTLLVNHELGNTAGVVRSHGAAGSFVSKWNINKSTLQAVSGSDLIQDLFIWNGSSYVDSAYAIARLCSGDLPVTSAFFNSANGNGTTNRIYMNGEETGPEGKAFAHIISGPDAGKSYQLPYLGKFSWENAVASPLMTQKTVVIGTDDATPGQVYVYVGNKTATGNDIEKAGLNNGKLYGVRVPGLSIVGNLEQNAYVPAPGSAFTMVDLGFVNNLTGAQLETNSTTLGVTRFLRPEDGHFDPNNPNDFYFVTTNNFTSNSRLWRLRFNDITNPESGGTITALLEGAEGQKMLDNMTLDSYGNVLIQEDPGNQSYLARLWNYDIDTDVLTEIAVHDSARFLSGGSQFLTQDEESSGIIEVPFLGAGNFIINTQAHYPIPGELVEGGQLMVLYNPATAASCVPTASTTTQSACGSFTWNGTTYTASGIYVFNTLNAAGCDSIATLNLTITNGPVWYADVDGDSYGDLNNTINACTQPSGYVGNSNDCDDNSAAVNPLAAEICNGIDDNCNALIDQADPTYQGIAPAGTISGMLVSCVPPGAGSTTYSVAAVPGATSYNWVVPSGLTIVSGQGTNSIVVSWLSITIDPVIQGTISVTASNACASSAPSTASIQLATVAPVTPGSISGASKVCPGDVVTYSVALVARATAYNWTVPTGMTINSGNGTNVINVSVGVGYVGGTISVSAANICGSSPVRTRTVSLNFPNTPGIISGQANGVCQTNGVAYSIAAIANATSYTWTVPAGATITSGQGTTGILVDFGAGFTSGQVTVVSVNACGNSAIRSLTVTGTPARPGPVSGVVNPACGGQSYQYGVATVPGTSQYLWSVTPGGSVSFPFPLVANGKDAQLTWGSAPLPVQTVQVRAANACGTSLTRTVSVTISNCPRLGDVENTNWFVYPNPASGKVFINMNAGNTEVFTVSVFDATARLLDVRQFNAQAGANVFELELGNYASGIYNLVLQSDSGKTVQRLIIE